jgi:hypothetical protein
LLRSQADYWMSQAMLAGSKILSAQRAKWQTLPCSWKASVPRPEIDMQIGPAWGG